MVGYIAALELIQIHKRILEVIPNEWYMQLVMGIQIPESSLVEIELM